MSKAARMTYARRLLADMAERGIVVIRDDVGTWKLIVPQAARTWADSIADEVTEYRRELIALSAVDPHDEGDQE